MRAQILVPWMTSRQNIFFFVFMEKKKCLGISFLSGNSRFLLL